MKRIVNLCTASAVLVVLLAMACNDGAQPPKTEASAVCSGFNDSKNYHVLEPVAGDTFGVGDEVRIRVCSSDTDAYVFDGGVVLSLDGGNSWVDLPEMGGFSEVLWTIPDSVLNPLSAENVSTVSDQCLIRYLPYTGGGADPVTDADTTDGTFSILK